MQNIELAYWILFSIIGIIAVLTATRKMSFGIGMVMIGLGFIATYFLSAYMSIIINPVGQALFYGANWTIPAILGALHLTTLILIVVMAGYNLLSSGGKIIWA